MIEHGADVNYVNPDGSTAFYGVIVENWYTEVVNWFLNAGFDLSNRGPLPKNDEKELIFSVAKYMNYDAEEVFQILLERNAPYRVFLLT